MRKNKGFTLIELMVVLAIIAILASIAFPSYQSSVRESRRADAFAGLTRMADMQERFYLQNRTYTMDEASVGGANTVEGYYTLSVTAADANTYTLQAEVVAGGPQVGDFEGGTDCQILTMTSAGLKTPAACW